MYIPTFYYTTNIIALAISFQLDRPLQSKKSLKRSEQMLARGNKKLNRTGNNSNISVALLWANYRENEMRCIAGRATRTHERVPREK